MRWGEKGWAQATSCSMPSGELGNRRWASAGRTWASRKLLQTSTPISVRAGAGLGFMRGPSNHEKATEPMAFLFELVNTGFAPSDYTNHGSPISAWTQLTPGLLRSPRKTVSPRNGFVFHNPGFNG